MKRFLFSAILGGMMLSATTAVAQERLPEYLQAEKFTESKLKNMLFSTMVDPHWFQNGNGFWYEYKTSEGKFWYVVNPSQKKKELLFDRDKLAAQLTEIVKDPFEARQLPVKNLKAEADGRTFTFEVVSSQDEKQVFYFSYDFPTKKLTHLTDKEKEPKKLDWASVSPDGQSVVYAKDCNLYRMSIADYRKAQKDEKDSTIVEIQLTTDGMSDFGYGIPYSILNTDTLCNGKRRKAWGCWSPDSKHFVTIVSDDRAVKPLWVINSIAEPRPTLETYKYQMPGEMEAPEEHLYIFDMTSNTRKEIKVSAWKNQWLGLEEKPLEKKQRDMEFRPSVWQGDNNRFFVTRYSRDLHRIDVCTYTVGEDSIVPIVKERMNTYQETRPIHVINGGNEFVQWSERDGWAHLYLY
ncbi:MAG: DPP IV N-terminal domain-containing protein, partial [Phocaeicola sp.]